MVETKKTMRTLMGKVESNKMDKTVTVRVPRLVKHPVVGKIIKLSTKVHAHDEKNELNEGDLVEITESKPVSKNKFWIVTKVVTKAVQEK